MNHEIHERREKIIMKLYKIFFLKIILVFLVPFAFNAYPSVSGEEVW